MLNLNNNYILTLDIGSSKVSAVLAEVKRKSIRRLFFDSLPTKGVKKGIIIDSIELVSTVSKLLKNLKAKSGIKIKLLNINISGDDIVTKHSRAILPLAEKGNKVISAQDIERVNEQARILGSSLEEEIIHLIPINYAIDSKNNVANPIGLYSHKLEVDLYLVCGKVSSIQSISRVINQAGYEIRGLSFSGLATSQAVMDDELKNGINFFCDIGSDITELVLFRDGVPADIEILPLGGGDLTLTLQEEFKIPFELAEDIKRSYGIITDAQQIKEDKEILVKKSNLYKPIKQRLVTELITASSRSICSKIREAAEKKISCYEVNNFIVTGRTVLLEGFIETLESTLSIPVRLGRIANRDLVAYAKEYSELSGQKYLAYLTCLGMIAEALQDKKLLSFLPASQQPARNPFIKAARRVKEVYQEYF